MKPDTVNPPPARNITTEMLQSLAGFQQTAGPQLALDQQIQPGYNALNLDLSAQSLFGYTDDQGVHHPGQMEMGRTAATTQRGGDIADVERFGGRASAAFLSANPLLRDSLTRLNARTGDSGLLRTLNRRAGDELALDGRLSASDVRDVTQGTRAGYADRGMVGGNPALGAELLARDAATRQRRDAGRTFASGVQGMNQQQNDFVGRTAQINASALSDPFMAILGRSSGSGAGGGVGGGRQMIGTGASMFDPQNAYAADVFNTNYNAQASANIANANNQAAHQNAKLSAAASIAVAALMFSDKRLKENIRTVGKSPSGIPEKEWNYLGDKKRRFHGAVAQDVEKIAPGAVITMPLTGHKLVDTSRIDVPFYQVPSLGNRMKQKLAA